jgi:hypothetical protein
VNADEVATPLALVVSISVAVEFDAKVPLAPVAGAVNVTDTPATGTGLPPLSTTVATSGFVNAVLITALCPLPLVALTAAAAPAVFVRLKLAVVDAPVAAADTV